MWACLQVGARVPIIYHILLQFNIITIMSQLPILSNETKQMLTARGYSLDLIYEANRRPDWMIPRTTAYNIATLVIGGVALAGMVITKKLGLFYQGFGLTLLAIPTVDFFHRREIDNINLRNVTPASLQSRIEMFPEFKEAYNIVNAELDARIAELEEKKKAKFAI